jgi:two-component system sensor histidine kinase HydH
LKKTRASNDADGELLEFIPEEVRRLNDILEGYLRFARDEPLALADCDLGQIVRRTASLTRETLAESGVRLEVLAADGEVPIRADAQRIHQVLLNLLLNAAQAMPSGGEITLELAADEKRATLRVADRGHGFTKDGLRNAAEPFATTKERGSGLGLAMAKRIAEAHGGSIALANRDGGGAVVTFVLPRVPAG